MSTWDGNNFYFSGQGVVLIGERDAFGKPAGLVPVGNVSDLKISIDTTVIEHKESQTGQRGIDLRLTTETNASLSITMENFIAENLALALRGTKTVFAAGMVTGEDMRIFEGMVMPLARARVSLVDIDALGALSLVTFVDDDTPWDYKLNAEAGSVLFNGDDSTWDELLNSGLTPTAITVGATTVLTYAAGVLDNTEVGEFVYPSGFTGANAGDINGQGPLTILSKTALTITIDLDTTGDIITTAAGTRTFITGGAVTAQVDYSFEDQSLVDSLTEGSQERYMRFEGLNTADDNKPVVVEVFKFLVDPLQELALISDDIGQFVLEGNALADPLQTTGSKYFKATMLRP